MTEPSSARPLPGPPRPGPAAANSAATPDGPAEAPPGGTSFEDLGQRPVSEHVGVFEEEHARLQRELGTIDQL
jgi:hypothetical protein